MKRWMYAFGFILCAGLAYWAYSIASKTRLASIELQEINSQILKEHEQIAVLKSEWAYLNRPERLRHLVELNFDKLGLVPIVAKNYGEASDIPYPSANVEPVATENQPSETSTDGDQNNGEQTQ